MAKYINLLKLYYLIFKNINNYSEFLQKPEGRGNSWKLYKGPILAKRVNNKMAGLEETRAQNFIFHAFESLEAKDTETFKKEMFDNIILGIIWYLNTDEQKEENEQYLESDSSGST